MIVNRRYGVPSLPLGPVFPQPQVSLSDVLIAASLAWAVYEGLRMLFDNGRASRDTFKYRAYVDNREVHGGITNDLVRRASEHRQVWPRVRLEQVGRRTTRKGAQHWERRSGY